MKRTLFYLIFTFCFSLFSYSQSISDNALGLRLGGNDGVGIEVSYQLLMSTNTRIEADFGFRNGNNYNGYKLAGIYQWVWELGTNFNWYAGAGAGLSNYRLTSYNPSNNSYYKYNKTYFFVAGDAGIEYNFDIPLLVSLDIRPELGSYYSGLGIDLAIGIRYQF